MQGGGGGPHAGRGGMRRPSTSWARPWDSGGSALALLDKRLRRLRWQRGEPNQRAYGGLRHNMRNDFACGSLRKTQACLRQPPYRHSLKGSPLEDFDLCSLGGRMKTREKVQRKTTTVHMSGPCKLCTVGPESCLRAYGLPHDSFGVLVSSVVEQKIGNCSQHGPITRAHGTDLS